MSNMIRASVAALLLSLALPALAAVSVPKTFWGEAEIEFTCEQLAEQRDWLQDVMRRIVDQAVEDGCRLGAAECLAQSAVFVQARQLEAHLEAVQRAQCIDV